MQMEESVTYQAILRRGMQDGLQQGLQREARAVLLRLGRKKLGPPTAQHEAIIAAIDDVARLEALSEKILDVTTWDDLLKAD